MGDRRGVEGSRGNLSANVCQGVLIETHYRLPDATFTPSDCAEWLEGRLPRPVDDPEQWKVDED